MKNVGAGEQNKNVGRIMDGQCGGRSCTSMGNRLKMFKQRKEILLSTIVYTFFQPTDI